MVRLSKLLRAPALLALLALPGVTPTPASSSDGSRPWGGTRIQPLDTAALAGVASAGTSGAAEPVTAALGRTPRADEILSNETTFTRWAFVGRIANIYERPSSSSRAVARLHWY